MAHKLVTGLAFGAVVAAAALAATALWVFAPTPLPPCDCASRIVSLDKACTDAIGRQVAALQACEYRCPEPVTAP